jgi:serine/threonine protein kinase
LTENASFSTNGRRLCVVDDDKVALTIIAGALRRRGFEVHEFLDPREAMASLATERPVAVITDMQMPHLSGLEVVLEVRRRLGEEAPPVIVVSSVDDEALLEQAFRQGASDYLLKPVNERELAVKVEKAIRHLHPGGVGAPAHIPRRIGPWELLEPIGRGGTAAVFRSRRAGDDAEYALKVVWPHLTTSTEALLRFRREIDVLSQIDHPNLVKFHESGRHDGCFFYVMEFVRGGTLRDRIEARGPGSEADVLDLLASVAEPLGYLHARGLVHRDVKPGNIFYRQDGSVVLGDFGLAKRQDDHGITIAEEFIGTPLYLAPEVFESDKFDHRVDFYALGMCALELLLGHPPLEETDSVRLIARIVNEGIPTVRELVGNIHPKLAALLERVVARRAIDRPASAQELIEDVAALDSEIRD